MERLPGAAPSSVTGSPPPSGSWGAGEGLQAQSCQIIHIFSREFGNADFVHNYPISKNLAMQLIQIFFIFVSQHCVGQTKHICQADLACEGLVGALWTQQSPRLFSGS